ncbi:hypothetical protein VNO77_34402 [Canavalia gladiata]|uniref:Uncharacterized protein n=1 Tax=Canavalia gladiata TaxID=3824 RepID=A0AAN9KF03_CANGL
MRFGANAEFSILALPRASIDEIVHGHPLGAKLNTKPHRDFSSYQSRLNVTEFASSQVSPNSGLREGPFETSFSSRYMQLRSASGKGISSSSFCL